MGFFSKLWKGVKKTFKKIGKGIKKVFAKVGKWVNKLGVVGQIGMMFIPFGQIFGPMLSNLSSSFLGILGKGLASANPLIKGASWLVNAAYKTGSAIYKGYKTVTGAVTKFVGETVGFIGSKIPGVNKVIGKNAAGSFFGTGADSVLGRVGKQVTADWNGFKNAVGGIIEFKPTETGLEYMNRANLLKGEYRYKDKRLPKVPKPADIPVVDKSTTLPPLQGPVQPPLQGPVQPPLQGTSGLGAMQGPVRPGEDLQFTSGVNGTDGVLNVDVKTDTVPKVDTVPDEKSLLGKVGDSVAESAVELPANIATSLATTAAQQQVMGDPLTMPESRARNALNTPYGSRSFDIGQVIAAMPPLMTTPTNFYQSSDYNALIVNLLNSFGVPEGAFGNPYMNLSQK